MLHTQIAFRIVFGFFGFFVFVLPSPALTSRQTTTSPLLFARHEGATVLPQMQRPQPLPSTSAFLAPKNWCSHRLPRYPKTPKIMLYVPVTFLSRRWSVHKYVASARSLYYVKSYVISCHAARNLCSEICTGRKLLQHVVPRAVYPCVVWTDTLFAMPLNQARMQDRNQ